MYIYLFAFVRKVFSVYLLCPFLGIACLWDYSTGRIPNFLQFNILGIGLIYSFCFGGWKGVLIFLLKAVLVGSVIFPLFILSMLGAGDIKIIALAAGYFPVSKLLWFAFYLAVSAAVVSVIKLLVSRSVRERIRHFLLYVRETVNTKQIKPYHQTREGQIKSSIVMSGPVLFSALLALGGVY